MITLLSLSSLAVITYTNLYTSNMLSLTRPASPHCTFSSSTLLARRPSVSANSGEFTLALAPVNVTVIGTTLEAEKLNQMIAVEGHKTKEGEPIKTVVSTFRSSKKRLPTPYPSKKEEYFEKDIGERTISINSAFPIFLPNGELISELPSIGT